jgi:hypothetical protein
MVSLAWAVLSTSVDEYPASPHLPLRLMPQPGNFEARVNRVCCRSSLADNWLSSITPTNTFEQINTNEVRMISKFPSARYSQASIISEANSAGFKVLSPAELRLLDLGETKDHIVPMFEESIPDVKASDGMNWKWERTIRASFIRWLCVGPLNLIVDPSGISIVGARITDSLDLYSVNVPFPLEMSNCYFDKPLSLNEAQIPALDMRRSWVPGISAENLIVKGSVWLGYGFISTGEVLLRGTRITGDLDCSSGTFLYSAGSYVPPDERQGCALTFDRARIAGSVLLRRHSLEFPEFRAEGGVQLISAEIDGELDCSGGKFFSSEGISLNADNATIKSSVFLCQNFESRGEARFVQAQVIGGMECWGSVFSNPGQIALNLSACNVKMSVSFGQREDSPGTSIFGWVMLQAAQIGLTLDLQGLDLRTATLNLSGASSSFLADTSPKYWPRSNHLYLRGFQYSAIVSGTKAPRERLRWLALQPDDDFNSDAYAQLAKILLQSGDEDGSKLVLETLARLQTRRGHQFWYLAPSNLFEASIGYGYRPIWAIYYSLILGSLGWIIYRRSYLAGSMVPTDKDAYAEFRKSRTLPHNYPHLSPVIFSIETSLPLVKLGQADKWQPDPNPERHPNPISNEQKPASRVARRFRYTRLQAFDPARKLIAKVGVQIGLNPGLSGYSIDTQLSRKWTSPKFVRRFIWVQILLGWLFATLFVAGYGGLVHK